MQLKEAPIISPEVQIRIIKQTISLEDYVDFYTESFGEPSSFLWISKLRDHIKLNPEKRDNEAYFQFLTLFGEFCLQYGFGSLGEGLKRHDSKKWKNSAFNIEHLLGSTNYVAKIAQTANQMKETWENQLREESPAAAKGIWGIRLPVWKGEIVANDPKIELIKKSGIARIYSEQPIYLPTSNLINGFAAINFNGDEAETIPMQGFRPQVLKSVAEVLDGIIDPQRLFAGARVRAS